MASLMVRNELAQGAMLPLYGPHALGNATAVGEPWSEEQGRKESRGGQAGWLARWLAGWCAPTLQVPQERPKPISIGIGDAHGGGGCHQLREREKHDVEL